MDDLRPQRLPEQAVSATEHLTGKAMPMLDFIVSVRVVDGRATERHRDRTDRSR
ncbi:hypothetical protein ACFVAV_03770 [Nocardia sp. NPDC057663]|uniref:hypothetical protein n=1 Tax=Nocardia sp. NPDC057663 TaxID=3346201 RepID=UPI003671CB44